MKIPQWVQWAIGIVFCAGVVYSQVRGLPERVNIVEQKVSAVEANVTYIRQDVQWIREHIASRRVERSR